MATAELCLVDAVRALTLKHPDMGAKKLVSEVKAKHPALKVGTKEVRAALAEVNAAASPAVSPSASPVKGAADVNGLTVVDESQAAEEAPVESARQQKVRERQEAQKLVAKENKAREKRKQAAFKKLFPELDLEAAFGWGVEGRVRNKAKAELKAKLTDQAYLTSAVLEGRLSPDDLQELVQDMKAGGFTPSVPTASDEDDSEEEDAAAAVEPAAVGSELNKSRSSLQARAPKTDRSALGLPSFGEQA